MRDLLGAPADEVAAERARGATEGLGARLLALQGADGRWGGAAWNHGWNSTMHVLLLLRDLGLDPASEQAHRAVGLVRERVTWMGCGPQECDHNPFFAGEVEPCINGQVGAAGAYFGQDVRGIVDRLLGEQLPDGGWNCDGMLLEIDASFPAHPVVAASIASSGAATVAPLASGGACTVGSTTRCYVRAASTFSLTAEARSTAVPIPYLLFSHTHRSGRFHTLDRFIASWK